MLACCCGEQLTRRRGMGLLVGHGATRAAFGHSACCLLTADLLAAELKQQSRTAEPVRKKQVLVRAFTEGYYSGPWCIPEDLFTDAGPTFVALLLKLETVATDIIRPARYVMQQFNNCNNVMLQTCLGGICLPFRWPGRPPVPTPVS